MIKARFISLLIIIVAMSCSSSREEEASQKLDEVIELRDSARYNEAKLKLDTIFNQYSDLPDQMEFARRLLDDILLMEQERTLDYLDSMIIEKEKELTLFMKNFIESDEYGTETILVHRRQRPENSYNRIFIRAHLNTSGEFYISSRYYGEEWIEHNQIKVYHGGESITSEVIPEDGVNNRRFEDGEDKWEIVSYKGGADNGIVDFIASNVEKPLKAQFIGKKYYYIVLEKFDKEAIRDGYETSFVLQELAGLRNEREMVQDKIRQLSDD